MDNETIREHFDHILKSGMVKMDAIQLHALISVGWESLDMVLWRDAHEGYFRWVTPRFVGVFVPTAVQGGETKILHGDLEIRGQIPDDILILRWWQMNVHPRPGAYYVFLEQGIKN